MSRRVENRRHGHAFFSLQTHVPLLRRALKMESGKPVLFLLERALATEVMLAAIEERQ